MKYYVIFTILLLSLPFALAQEDSITLLAITYTGQNDTGSIGTLELEIVEQGAGKVFIETIPLSRVSTQASMRFAQQVACQHTQNHCQEKNFFYTIRGSAGLVSGPSAGAAASVLTSALLNNQALNDSVSITGTINSGGIIGPVGGIEEKIRAAAAQNITLILIPQGTEELSTNTTATMLGRELGVTVKEVGTLQEALASFTNTPYVRNTTTLTLPESYTATIAQVAEDLCQEERQTPHNNTVAERIANLTRQATERQSLAQHYAAASYCFRANVLSTIAEQEHISLHEQEISLLLLEQELEHFENITNAQALETVTDVQTYMAVKERLRKTREHLLTARLHNDTRALALATERFSSAVSWSRFFNNSGNRFTLSQALLQERCAEQVIQAEERYNYLRQVLDYPFAAAEEGLQTATTDQNNEHYLECLYYATKTRADVDGTLSLLGVLPERYDELIGLKLNATGEALNRANTAGVFPLIGANYYEYALALREEEPRTALLYAEYALAFSNLDIGVASSIQERERSARSFSLSTPESLLIGTVLGALLTMFYVSLVLRRKR